MAALTRGFLARSVSLRSLRRPRLDGMFSPSKRTTVSSE
jgi:hypothetical protein